MSAETMSALGIIHILRNQQGGEGGGRSLAKYYSVLRGRRGGGRSDQKIILINTNMWMGDT